jgi:ribosome-associated translation inhibitor RaiA
MKEQLNHKLDISKLKTIKDVKNVFECMGLYSNASEDNEQYELLKEYFTIPNEPQEIKLELPRKSLEEISQEFDEQIDKRIERVKEKFNQLGYTQEYHYQVKFNRIFENFEYAKEHGQFPVRLTVGTSDGSYLVANNTVSWNTEYRIGVDEVGYWDIKPNIKVYLKKKPNVIVRYFTKLLLDFTWKDK